MTNLLFLNAHAISEYDHVRMFTDLGYDVFSIGAYIDPAHPHVDIRPPLPDAAQHPDLAAVVDAVPGGQLTAKEHLPDAVIDWADTIIVEHYPAQWVFRQWERIRHKDVVWRTCGQSDVPLEQLMAPLRRQGLRIVRYSPAERRYFEGMGSFAGQDALIRFGKYPGDYGGWTGDEPYVANVTQDMRGRGEWCGLSWYLHATEGLDARPAGHESDRLPGGLGLLPYDGMIDYLRRARAYVYTGTHPASYTLGLMEALLVGVPVVSIGAQAWMGPADLFEAAELTGWAFDDPAAARRDLAALLADPEGYVALGQAQRHRALDLFDVATVGPQWREFLGAPRGATAEVAA